MQLPYSDQLNIAALSRLFDNKSECYKLFWFQAILGEVCAGKSEILYEDLIDEMIADAWYMVTEYHLNLGPRDTLEKTVDYIYQTTGMLPSVKKQDILNWLKNCEDPAVIDNKRKLTLNVPYRLQAPFFEGFRNETWKCGTKELASRINRQKRLMYYFDAVSGLQTVIHIDPDWEHYFPRLAELEYHSYRMIWTYDKVRAEFQKCAREHLNSPEIEHRLYRPGLEQNEFKLQLSEVIYPVYQSAKNCGFRRWEYSHE